MLEFMHRYKVSIPKQMKDHNVGGFEYKLAYVKSHFDIHVL